MSSQVSPLGPIDPASVPEAETEKHAPWIVRKLVGVRPPPSSRPLPAATPSDESRPRPPAVR